jgi:hypothetical protein
MGRKSEVTENRAFEQRGDLGARLKETMVLGLGGQVTAWYSGLWRVLRGGTAHFWRMKMRRSAGRCQRVDMARLNENEALEGPGGGENTCKSRRVREGMKDYGPIVDAAGCRRFWVSVGLESSNNLYHLGRVLGRWDVV